MAFRVSREEGHAERAAAGIGQGTGQAPVDLGAVLIGNRATYEGESALGIGMNGENKFPGFFSSRRVVLPSRSVSKRQIPYERDQTKPLD
jgi:hypothetical protein